MDKSHESIATSNKYVTFFYYLSKIRKSTTEKRHALFYKCLLDKKVKKKHCTIACAYLFIHLLKQRLNMHVLQISQFNKK